MKDIISSISIGRNFLSFSRYNPSMSSIKWSIADITKKMKKNKSIVPYKHYMDFFELIEELKLKKDFTINTTKDNITISCSIINPIIVNNENNNKIVIICHGITNNRWNMFYCTNLFLQMGYRVIIYDARNHGLSEGKYNTLGIVESDDLEDIINYTITNFNPQKIGLYGFSMGAATLLFWLSKFQSKHKNKVSFIICEAPFDNFSKRFKSFLGTKRNRFGIIIRSAINMLIKSPINLDEINPIDTLPNKILIGKVLLLHGMNDKVIDYKSSLNIFKKLEENNPKSVNLYLFKDAGHGDLTFFGDFVQKSIFWKNEKTQSSFNFSQLIRKFSEKNFI